MKVSELAEKIEISITKARRYAKEILPPDKDATQQSGKARDITENEGFLIWLGLHLVNKMGFSMKDTKAIINDLKPWMRSKGLFPTLKFKPDKPIKDYDILIMRANTKSGFWYEAKGHIQTRSIKIQGTAATEEKYILSPVIKPPKLLKHDEFNVSTLQISLLLKMYCVKIKGFEALRDFRI